MPELPEVETVVRELRPQLVGRQVLAVQVSRKSLRSRWQESWKTAVCGQAICAVQRRGKWILIDLDGPWLLLHLGMTGQLTVAFPQEPLLSHTHLVFSLAGEIHGPGPIRKSSPSSQIDRQLRFRDVRRFGSATLFADRKKLDQFFHQKCLGPEPFHLDAAYWQKQLAGTRRSLKAILLDQSVLAGVGNIYADESLFEARLHPARLGNSLVPVEAERLRKAIVKVLNRAILKRGSSIRDYIGGNGKKGGFQDEFRVYGRTGKPCTRCRTSIQRFLLAGRSTHFCPKCQHPSSKARQSV